MEGGSFKVTVRFSSGGCTYKVYSNWKGKGGAGVKVFDSKGKLVSDISCWGKPEIYIGYLRESLPCDMQNPHGAAACKEVPYKTK